MPSHLLLCLSFIYGPQFLFVRGWWRTLVRIVAGIFSIFPTDFSTKITSTLFLVTPTPKPTKPLHHCTLRSPKNSFLGVRIFSQLCGQISTDSLIENSPRSHQLNPLHRLYKTHPLIGCRHLPFTAQVPFPSSCDIFFCALFPPFFSLFDPHPPLCCFVMVVVHSLATNYHPPTQNLRPKVTPTSCLRKFLNQLPNQA